MAVPSWAAAPASIAWMPWPSNVTVAGESAGAGSICMHLAAPERSRGLFHKAVLISAPLLMRGARDEMRRYIGYAHQSSDPVTASNDRERLRADYATDSGSEDGIRRRSFRRPQPSLPPLLLHPPHRWARSAASLPAPGAADAADGGLLRQQRRTQCPRTSHLAGDADAMAAQQGQAPAGATSPQ